MSNKIEERRQVRCKHCGDTFSYIIRVTPEQLKEDRIIVTMTCPFCGHRLGVDLAPWKRRMDTSYREQKDEQLPVTDITLKLPEELPTTLIED